MRRGDDPTKVDDNNLPNNLNDIVRYAGAFNFRPLCDNLFHSGGAHNTSGGGSGSAHSEQRALLCVRAAALAHSLAGCECVRA